jgi:RNA polymerase sigma factor (sigma-70 family)
MAMHERSDQDLVDEAKAGSDAAFAALYVRYERAVRARCFGVLRDHHEAADAAQNAMLSALRALRRDDPPSNPRGWLLSIARNEAVSLLRRSRPAEPLEAHPAGAGPGADEGAFERERLRQLVDDLNALPDRQRGALLLREASGFSYRDIASALGTSAGNARQTVHAARRNMHKRRVGREHGWLGFALPGVAVAWLETLTANLTGVGKAALLAGAIAVGGGAASQLDDAGGGLLSAAAPPTALANPPRAQAAALDELPRHLVAAPPLRPPAASSTTAADPPPAHLPVTPSPATQRSQGAVDDAAAADARRPAPVAEMARHTRPPTPQSGAEIPSLGELPGDRQARPVRARDLAAAPGAGAGAHPAQAGACADA